jgi:uncharacterized membrane protein
MFGSDWFWITLAGYALLAPLAALLLGWWALRRGRDLRTELARLRLELRQVGQQTPETDRRAEQVAPTPEEKPVDEPTVPGAGTGELSLSTAPPSPAEKKGAETPAPPEDDRRAVRASPFAPEETRRPGWEQRLASRWLLWLGGIALALGGGFLVKVSIDMGLIGPAVRCIAGAGLGLALIVGGEVLRRRPLQIAIAAQAPNYLPPALSAAGLAMLFASIFAAHGLYQFIGAPVAFILLGATAFVGVGLALLQGPFIAALGLLGGFATPFIVSAAKPAMLPLFAFLLALTVASLAVARYRDWRWLAALALAGANAWAMLWSGFSLSMESPPVFTLYLLALALAAVWYRHDLLRLDFADLTPRPGGPATGKPWEGLDLLVSGAFASLFLNAFFFARLDHYGPWSLAALALLAAFSLFQGRRTTSLAALPALAALAAVVTLAAWHLPQFVPGPEPLIVLEQGPVAHPRAPIVPPELLSFVLVSAGFAALFGLAGYTFARGARRPGAWGLLSGGTPLALLIVCYWRVEDFAVALPWAVASLALAALAVLAAARCERAGPPLRGALGAYAVTAVGAITLAATMELREAWLTVALAVQLPAIAWIDRRLKLRPLHVAAAVLAGIIIVRLVFIQTLLTGSPVGHPLFNWIVYGYGLPAIFFALATRLFRGRSDDLLVTLLETGTILFVTLLVTFEIRSFFNEGEIGRSAFALAELATQILAWIGLAIGLFWINRSRGRPVLLWAWRLIGAWALLILVGALTVANPLNTGAPVGEWHIVNLLALTYLAPAILLAIFAWLLADQGGRIWALITRIAVLVLIFAWMSLELRHAFHGTNIAHYLGTSDAEWYGYSLLWLAFAALLFVAGIRLRNTGLRHAGLALLSLVVLKVFLSDMGALTGLYRALSFLGLGASLIGLGYLYQRFVFPPKKEADGSGAKAGTA